MLLLVLQSLKVLMPLMILILEYCTHYEFLCNISVIVSKSSFFLSLV